MPVFGLTAVDFGPTDDTLASIGATEPTTTPLGSRWARSGSSTAQTGTTRTLLDGPVVSFAWAPDGKMIAAIRLVQGVAGGFNASTGSPNDIAGTECETIRGPPDLRGRRVGQDPVGVRRSRRGPTTSTR